MSRKGHSFLHEYPRIRVDRFTESREHIPTSLQPQWHNGHRVAGPWDDLDNDGGECAPQSDDEDDDGLGESSSQKQLNNSYRQSLSASEARTSQLSVFPHPTVQLLTHIHIDHLEGLNTPQHNGAPIYCSEATKEMLLLLEPKASRRARDRGQQLGDGVRKRPYAWLRRTPEQSAAVLRFRGVRAPPHDILHALPFNTPTEVDYLPNVKVTITLLDSNHMTGGSMFLVEGHRGAVLHMGDCRAEKWWLEALVRNPVMQRYARWEERRDNDDDDDASTGSASLPSRICATPSAIAAQHSLAGIETQATTSSSARAATATSSRKRLADATTPSPSKAARVDHGHLRLQNITVDDEWISVGGQPPGKQDAARDLVDMIRKYPKDTTFVIDGWTWGYEDIYVAIGKMLRGSGEGGGGAKIHVDRYKFDMYTAAKDPCAAFMTRAAASTRFHACDLVGDCAHLQDDDLSQRAAETEAYSSLSQRWHGPEVLPLSRRQVESVRASAAAKRASQQEPRPPLNVLIRIIEADEETWEELRGKSLAAIEKARRGEGDYPPWLACPIQRHTTLPELQQFVRAFRPRNITPQTSDKEKYFVVAKFLGPCLDKDGQARLEAETKEAIGLAEWDNCEEALRWAPEGSGGEQRTQAQQLEAFRARRRRTTLDLSQEESEKRKEGGLQKQQRPREVSAGLAAQMSQRRVAGAATLASVAVVGPSSGNAAEPSTTTTNTTRPSLQPRQPSTTILDDDLSRRYFIVLRNVVQPGLVIDNLPGGRESPQAWRAVRFVAPDLALATELMMQQEVGVVPPEWGSSPAATPQGSRSASGAGPLEDEGGARDVGVGPSGLRHVLGAQEESSASASVAAAQLGGSSNSNDGGDEGGWIHQHLLWGGNAPLRLEDLCVKDGTRLDAAHSRLKEQTSSFVRVLAEASQREDGSLSFAKQYAILCDPLIDALSIVGQSSSSEGERGAASKAETLLLLVALTDVALQLAAFIFAAAKESGVRIDEAVEGQLTIALVECATGVEALLKGLEGGEGSSGGGGGGGQVLCGGKSWKEEERAESAVLLKRLQKTVGLVEEEARR